MVLSSGHFGFAMRWRKAVLWFGRGFAGQSSRNHAISGHAGVDESALIHGHQEQAEPRRACGFSRTIAVIRYRIKQAPRLPMPSIIAWKSMIVPCCFPARGVPAASQDGVHPIERNLRDCAPFQLLQSET